MRLLTTSVLIATLGLSACGESRLNPVNWFGNGRSQPVAQTTTVETNPLIPTEERGNLFTVFGRRDVEYTGAPVDQVTELVIERVPGGAIVRAAGVASYDGPFGVQLTPVNEDAEPVDGVLTYRLEAERPRDAGRTTATQVRTVNAAVRLTDRDLAGVKTIRVEGVRNAQTSARR
ncbi:MAG: hypothetical protein ABJ263_06975 [Tateyamaria sp.]|uniref:hypothetical protein n=1 Tax=Tateyamaria sp. TaxID=1929288 RepID=UPI00326BD5C9